MGASHLFGLEHPPIGCDHLSLECSVVLISPRLKQLYPRVDGSGGLKRWCDQAIGGRSIARKKRLVENYFGAKRGVYIGMSAGWCVSNC